MRPTTIVEIGSYRGRSTTLLALAQERFAPTGKEVAIDPHTGDRQDLAKHGLATLPSFDQFSRNVSAAGVSHRVTPIVALSHDAVVGWNEPIDMLFVDGWHSCAVLQDGHDWLPFLRPGGVVIFDDYMVYHEVKRAVHISRQTGNSTLYGVMGTQASAVLRASDGIS